MGNENGTWIMYGVEWDDPECLHTVQDAINYINEVGFLPLFKNDIPGFSLEERTVPEYWWCGDPEVDPWEWRELIARSGEVAYGKFFEKKAGFISKEWLPYFVNYRRDGYDFDALYEDGKASARQKKIMDLFAEELIDEEYYSNELKEKAGFGKDGAKGFDGIMTGLQMQMYLCVRDFRQRKNKKGEAYGWPIAIYATPEHMWGFDYARSAYAESPTESAKRIAKHIMDVYPVTTPEQIRGVIGIKAGERKEPEKKKIKVDYPANLLKELGLEFPSLSHDQILGLEYVLGQLRDESQEIIKLRYEEGRSYKDIAAVIGRTGGTTSKRCKKAIELMKDPNRIVWIKEGFNGHLGGHDEEIDKVKEELISQGKYKDEA